MNQPVHQGKFPKMLNEEQRRNKPSKRQIRRMVRRANQLAKQESNICGAPQGVNQPASAQNRPERFFTTKTIQVFGAAPSPAAMRGEMSNTVTYAYQPTPSSRPAQFSGDTNAQPGKTNGEANTIPSAKFPNLVVFMGPGFKKGPYYISKSFADSHYGNLEFITTRSMNPAGGVGWVTVKISLNGECLAESGAPYRPEALAAAIAVLLNELRKTNYIIEVKNSYVPFKSVPCYVLKADPSLSHIYKVVCLKTPTMPPFPHPLSGSIDYVSSEVEMWQYIQDHARSGTSADLFVLNVGKQHHSSVREMVTPLGWAARHLRGCSDLGLMLNKIDVNVHELLQELLKCGGETIKHRLTTPGSDPLSDYDHLDLMSDTLQGRNTQILCAPTQNPSSSQEDSEIVVNPWIADNLILVERIEMNGDIVIPRELIFLAVRDCTELEEFIIEKKRDPITRIITAEALIDRRVVGRAKARSVLGVKKMAADDALHNLRKCCRYIEAKKSYFGINGSYPAFLRDKKSISNSKIYRIANPSEASTEHELDKLLVQFNSSPYQDLFFLKDFPLKTREIVFNLARNRGKTLQVWTFGNNCVCVYKKIRAKQIYQELMATKNLENEKFRLILPNTNTRVEPESPAIHATCTQYGNEVKRLENLFDFANEDEKPIKRECSPSPEFHKSFDMGPSATISRQRTEQPVSFNNRSENVEPHSRTYKENVGFGSLERNEQSFGSSNIQPFVRGVGSIKGNDPVLTRPLSSQVNSKEFPIKIELSKREDRQYNDDLGILGQARYEMSKPWFNKTEFSQEMNERSDNSRHLNEQRFTDKIEIPQDTLSPHGLVERQQETSYVDDTEFRPRQVFDYTHLTRDKKPLDDQRSGDLHDEDKRGYWKQPEDMLGREGRFDDQGPHNQRKGLRNPDLPEKQDDRQSWMEHQQPPYREKRSFSEGPGEWEEDSKIPRPSERYEGNRESWQESRRPLNTERVPHDIRASDWRGDPQNSERPGSYGNEYWQEREQSSNRDKHIFGEDYLVKGPRRQSWKQIEEPLSRDNKSCDQKSDSWSEEYKKTSYGQRPVDWRESSLSESCKEDGRALWKKRKEEMIAETHFYSQADGPQRTYGDSRESLQRMQQPSIRNDPPFHRDPVGEREPLFDAYASPRDSFDRPLNRNYSPFEDEVRRGWTSYK